jgi:hypothetical protein
MDDSQSSTDLRPLNDAQLLAQCGFEAFRGSGPGGQKRNKTSSAVRITHKASGIAVVAGESRSQHQNKRIALVRLRHRMALEIRRPWTPGQSRLPGRLSQASPKKRLEISRRDEEYPGLISAVLDILAALGWSISAAAGELGVTTAQLSGFLLGDDHLWTCVNQHRKSLGLRPLR